MCGGFVDTVMVSVKLFPGKETTTGLGINKFMRFSISISMPNVGQSCKPINLFFGVLFGGVFGVLSRRKSVGH